MTHDQLNLTDILQDHLLLLLVIVEVPVCLNDKNVNSGIEALFAQAYLSHNAEVIVLASIYQQ